MPGRYCQLAVLGAVRPHANRQNAGPHVIGREMLCARWLRKCTVKIEAPDPGDCNH
jgi:hypothetical protein